MSDSLELTVDGERLLVTDYAAGTGIFVRAKHNGKWGSFDIAVLDRDSLFRWLRSRGGENEWAEAVVFILLGHPTK